MFRSTPRRHPFLLLAALLGLTVLGSLAIGAEARADVTPSLTNASVRAATPGTVWVEGFDFTPGGNVYVAIYDRWGEQLYETRWTAADSTVMGSDGTSNPLTGYTEGGFVGESFSVPCGADAMVRAFDQSTGVWTTWLDVNAGC